MLEIIYLGASGLNKLLGLVTTGDKIVVAEKLGQDLIGKGLAEEKKGAKTKTVKKSKDVE